jgi:hypothetical protein
MNTMTFDKDGTCTIQGDGILHPADMRSTIQIIERILLPQALSAAQFCTIADYRNHDAARMCVREFVRKVKQSLDDVREHLYLLQGAEIDLWQLVQNFEYNVEDTSLIILQLFARTQPMQHNAQVVTPTSKMECHTMLGNTSGNPQTICHSIVNSQCASNYNYKWCDMLGML